MIIVIMDQSAHYFFNEKIDNSDKCCHKSPRFPHMFPHSLHVKIPTFPYLNFQTSQQILLDYLTLSKQASPQKTCVYPSIYSTLPDRKLDDIPPSNISAHRGSKLTSATYTPIIFLSIHNIILLLPPYFQSLL